MKILPPPVVKGTATSIFAPSAYCFRLSKLRPFDERFRVVTISSTISICSTSRYRTHAITFRLVRGVSPCLLRGPEAVVNPLAQVPGRTASSISKCRCSACSVVRGSAGLGAPPTRILPGRPIPACGTESTLARLGRGLSRLPRLAEIRSPTDSPPHQERKPHKCTLPPPP